MTPAKLKQSARQVRAAYADLVAAEGEAKNQAIRFGGLLNELRPEFVYGEFIPWLEDTFRGTFSYRTALVYMQVAEFASTNPQRAANCASVREILAEIRTSEDGPPYN